MGTAGWFKSVKLGKKMENSRVCSPQYLEYGHFMLLQFAEDDNELHQNL